MMLHLFSAGIAVCVGMASTFAYANSTFRHQVSLRVKETLQYCTLHTFPYSLNALEHH